MGYDYYGYDVSPYTSDYSSIDTIAATGIGAALGAFFGFIMIASIVIGVLQIIAMWKVYTKAGEKGWKSIIPIYNIVILFKISGLSPWLIFVYFAGLIPFVGWIAIMALSIYQAHSLAKSFGKDIGYTIGLVLLPTIFYMILGFGKSEYVGPAGEAAVIETSEDVTE